MTQLYNHIIENYGDIMIVLCRIYDRTKIYDRTFIYIIDFSTSEAGNCALCPKHLERSPWKLVDWVLRLPYWLSRVKPKTLRMVSAVTLAKRSLDVMIFPQMDC